MTITKIETQTFVPDGERRGGKKVKLISVCKITEEGKKKVDDDLNRKDQRGAEKQQE